MLSAVPLRPVICPPSPSPLATGPSPWAFPLSPLASFYLDISHTALYYCTPPAHAMIERTDKPVLLKLDFFVRRGGAVLVLMLSDGLVALGGPRRSTVQRVG